MKLQKFFRVLVIGVAAICGNLLRADDAPLRICLLSASAEYKSDDSLAILQKRLEEHLHAKCTLLQGKDKGDNLPSLAPLEHTDVMVLFTRRVVLNDEQLAQVQKYCQSGNGIVGIRTASHAFQNWLEMDKLVFGGNYQNHYKEGPDAAITLNEKAAGHPLLAGVTPFKTPAKMYKNPSLADDVTLLLTGASAPNVEPVAWARNHGAGRVFYTSLGSPEDFQVESFLRLLENAVVWTSKRDAPKK